MILVVVGVVVVVPGHRAVVGILSVVADHHAIVRGARGRAVEDAFPDRSRAGTTGGRAGVSGEEVCGHASVHAGSRSPYIQV